MGHMYDAEPQEHGRAVHRNTLRDAVVAAINLNIFNKHADRVQMANIHRCECVTGHVLTDKEKMCLRQPTTIQNVPVHQGATLIPIDLQCRS